MAITQTLTAPPATVLSRTSGDAFDADIKAWLSWHNTQQSEYTTFTTQANALITTVNVDATNAAASAAAALASENAAAASAVASAADRLKATSTTSITPALGSKTFTIAEAERGWVVGTELKSTSRSDITKWMIGTITDYTGSDVQINVTSKNGTVAAADWDMGLYASGAADSIDEMLSRLTVSTYTYVADKLTALTYPAGNKVNFTYTGDLLTTEQYTDTDGSTVLLTITHAYDASDNLTSSTRS